MGNLMAIIKIERGEFYKKYGDVLGLMPQGLFQIGLSRVARTTRTAIDNFIVEVGIIPSWQVGVQRTYDKNSTEWREFRQALQDIKAMSDEMNLLSPIFAVLNSDVHLTYSTNVDDLGETLPIYLRWYHQAEQTAAEVGFTTYNHEKEFIEQLAPDEIVVNELDAHPSAKVNSVYAQKLFEVITSYVRDGKLCVSASPQTPEPALDVPLTNRRLMRVQLGDNIRFLGYVMDKHVDSEEMLSLTFGWQALAQIDTNYAIHTYFLNGNGERWVERDTLPCHGDCPTVQWPPGMIAPPGSSTIYWPLSAKTIPLPLERVFERSHLTYQDYSKKTVEIMPLPLAIIPFPGSLVDKHEINLSAQLPSCEYTLVMSLYDPTTGELLPAYDEVAQMWLPEAGVVLGKVIIP